MAVNIWKSYVCTAVEETNIELILAVMNTAELVVEIRPEKKFRLVRDLNPWEQHLATILKCCQPFHFQDLIYLVMLLTVHHAILVIQIPIPIPISWEFGIGSAANPLLKFFFILITCLLDIVLILYGEILSWSLMGVKGFTAASCETLPSQIFFVNVLHF